MQTPKGRSSPSGATQKSSPRSISSEASPKNSSPQTASSEAPQKVSPRVARQLKTGPRFLDPTASSSNQASRAPKERSPKVVDHKSPRSPVPEPKKRASKVPELESQISQLEKDLKIVKDQLCSTEAQKKQAQKDAEESNQQLSSLSLKLEELQKQHSKQSASEEVISEHSEEQKSALQSELEAIREQSSNDSAALASALDEIKQLKIQLETVAESEASQSKNSEPEDLEKLKENLSETLSIVEDMKQQVVHSKESEARAQALVGETLLQLETAKKMVETLRSDGLKATDVYNAIASELDQSRARVEFLEDLVSKFKADMGSRNEDARGDVEGEIEMTEKKSSQDTVETEVPSCKLELEQLRSALEAAEIRYNEEQSCNAEQVRNAMEMVEKMKSASSQREAELESEIRKSKYEIEELKANLMDKETELQGICEENEGLTVKLESSISGQRENELERKLQESKAEIENLKASLTDREAEWQNTSKQNEKLKVESKETNNVRMSDDIDMESARAAETDATMKVCYMTEEIEKSNRMAARVSEQLEAAQAANAEMEAELRKLKVQSDQWRKAAEAAAAMLSAGNNGQMMERTGSMDSHYSPRTGKMSSPYADELDDELMKKKNANMLRRFGVLWKKPQK